MSKNLKYFMREAAEVERVVTVPAPESFKDENGKVIQLEVKVLSSERIRAINEGYHTHTVALDKKGNPYINGGNVVFRDERDNAKATRHILVEALQYPKLDDPELMKYYNCVDITQMPEKVFSRADEFAHVTRVVMALLGIGGQLSEEVLLCIKIFLNLSAMKRARAARRTGPMFFGSGTASDRRSSTE